MLKPIAMHVNLITDIRIRRRLMPLFLKPFILDSNSVIDFLRRCGKTTAFKGKYIFDPNRGEGRSKGQMAICGRNETLHLSIAKRVWPEKFPANIDDEMPSPNPNVSGGHIEVIYYDDRFHITFGGVSAYFDGKVELADKLKRRELAVNYLYELLKQRGISETSQIRCFRTYTTFWVKFNQL